MILYSNQIIHQKKPCLPAFDKESVKSYNPIMNKSSNNFHTIPLTKIAASLARCMDISAPEKAEPHLPELSKYLRGSGQPKVDKILLYNPDAIGAAFIDAFSEDFAKVEQRAPLRIPLVTEYPPITNACFCTMYTGAHNNVHGIMSNRDMELKTDTFFDAMRRDNKTSAIVAVGRSTMAKVFNNTAADVFPERYDGEVIKKAVDLIKDDKYDLIVVYNQEFDDLMHITHPKSALALKAMRTHIAAFELLADAVDVYWKEHNTIIGFAPDHGAHRKWYGLGAHGNYIPDDMNIYHYYGLIPKK